MSSVADRVRRDRILERFCESRSIHYQPVDGLENLTARLFDKDEKFCGFAGLHTDYRNYGSQPVSLAPMGRIDWLYELGELCGVKSAWIVKFRDKIGYWRIEAMGDLDSSDSKYQIPISLFHLI